MKLSGNTILITGGGTGIGRGLAEALDQLGNRIIIAGRRKENLEAVTRANPKIEFLQLDVENPNSIDSFASQAIASYPTLNVLINNAGIMRAENLTTPQDSLADAEAIVTTNLLGPIRLTTALLPHLQKQPYAAIMNVSSGLAFVPLAMTPTYCATKAAIHSYTLSLRYQLKNTKMDVLELIPPYVQTDLMGGASDPRAMPLDQYIAEVMQILKEQPDAKEICVKAVDRLRYAAETGKFDAVFQGFNDAMAAGH